MSGAWAKGANKAVSCAPPEGGFQTVGAGGRSSIGGGNSGNKNSNNNNSSNNNNRKTSGVGNQNNRRRSSAHSSGQNSGNNSNSGDGESSGRGGRGGRGRGRGGRGRGGGGRNHNQEHRHNNHRRGSQNSTGGGGGGGNSNNNDGKPERIIIKDAQLLEAGAGKTPAQKAVKRIPAKDFIMVRTQYLEADPDRFRPHQECHWTDETREQDIIAQCSKVMELGDVSKKTAPQDTAPPLEECKPLEVNEEKRWKSKVMSKQSSIIMDETEATEAPETDEEIVAKALLILNKISWTTLDKLTVKFMEQTNLQEKESIRHACIEMLIRKAQTEQHFGPMYAQLCAIISKQFKPFKKELLAHCQAEFETDTAHKIAKATKGITDPEEIEYHSLLIRKAYIGHIKFLGELYLRDVVKLAIMMYCLDELLKDETDEENLECFSHLMTTMGEKLDGHAKQNNKPFDWGKVRELRNSSKISNRIKFLLQDLLELKDRGWVQRRKTETAKSIADLHKELAKEEEAAKMNRRASSSSQINLRRSSSMAAAPPTTDEDGFVQIRRGSMKKVGSRQSFTNDQSTPSVPARPKAQELRRAVSTPVGMSADYPASPAKTKDISSKSSTVPSLPSIVSPPTPKICTPDECASKAKSILKEYFVGGDTADAVLSVEELVHAGTDGSIDRGAKVIESGVLMVMEMKELEVKKFLTVMESCVKDSKIENKSIINGLNDPLEFLSDIEIDAPLSRKHLALILSEFMKWNAIDFELLKDAPEYFRTEGKAAAFAISILKNRGGEPSESEMETVSYLMTDEDKNAHASTKAMFDSL